MVDLGTGDGTFAYQTAKQNPHTFVIGIDPCYENLIELSSKALKKPSKGGLSNLIYVVSSVENLPSELNNIADKVYINFPWGTLLQGVVHVNDVTWQNIKKICKANATIQVIFGYSPLHDKKEIERLNLPLLDESYIQTMLVNLKGLGFKILDFKKLKPSDLKDYPSTWAKKLSFGSDRDYYLIALKFI